MATVTPSAPAGRQVTYYNYSPNPDAATTPTALRTGGGTNHASVDAAGHVLVTASNAQRTTATAVFKVALTPPRSRRGTGTAALRPTFLDNAIATKGNKGTEPTDSTSATSTLPQSSRKAARASAAAT
jgi:hypothetical protein